METWKLISIFDEKGYFMSLNEIYDEFSSRYSVENYKDFRAAIRTEIYRNCVERDLNISNKNIFVSVEPKGTVGQKYGLYSWISMENKEQKSNVKLVVEKPCEPLMKEIFCRPHNNEIKEEALSAANYVCEVNVEHSSFIRKKDLKNHTEAHHLIPLA